MDNINFANIIIKTKEILVSLSISFVFSILTIPQNCKKFKTAILSNIVLYKIRGVKIGRFLFRDNK